MFKQVTIIGVGLLGGSLAKALRQYDLAECIIGVCRSQKSADVALKERVVDQVLPIEEAVKSADLVVLAIPMQAMLDQLDSIANNVPENCILTDVGSVKESLYQQVKRHYPQLLSQFVFAHPIAGGEHSGVTAAKTGLFLDKNVVITPSEEVLGDATRKVSELWQRIGATTVQMSLQQHDAIFAKTSHLPHMIAFSLVNFLQDQQDSNVLFDMAAAGFYDFTRIASSDATMWRDICITNQQQLLQALEGFRAQLDSLSDLISNADQTAIYQQFSQAKAARDAGLAIKKQR